MFKTGGLCNVIINKKYVFKKRFETISDEKINNASELELADKIKREREERIKSGDKYQKEIKDELIELFDDNYFSLMEEFDKYSGDISDDEFQKRFDFNVKKLRYYIDYALPELLGRINLLAKKNKIAIVSHNSLRDVLSNSIFSGMMATIWIRKHINDDDERIKNKITNDNSARRRSLRNFSELISSEEIKYYINELCSGNEKTIKLEVGKEHGFLSEFADYFNENEYGKIFPTGSGKLPYFRFFSEVKKWKDGRESEINEDNFGEEFDKLDNKFINKEKIRKEFLER